MNTARFHPSSGGVVVVVMLVLHERPVAAPVVCLGRLAPEAIERPRGRIVDRRDDGGDGGDRHDGGDHFFAQRQRAPRAIDEHALGAALDGGNHEQRRDGHGGQQVPRRVVDRALLQRLAALRIRGLIRKMSDGREYHA